MDLFIYKALKENLGFEESLSYGQLMNDFIYLFF